MIGLVLIGGTIYSFVGMIESELRWPVFWSCAAGALAIIVYRNYIKKRKKNTQILYHKITNKISNRQIYKGAFQVNLGDMTEQTVEWWKGLGEELETDIETLDAKTENS